MCFSLQDLRQKYQPSFPALNIAWPNSMAPPLLNQILNLPSPVQLPEIKKWYYMFGFWFEIKTEQWNSFKPLHTFRDFKIAKVW